MVSSGMPLAQAVVAALIRKECGLIWGKPSREVRWFRTEEKWERWTGRRFGEQNKGPGE